MFQLARVHVKLTPEAKQLLAIVTRFLLAIDVLRDSKRELD